MIDKRFFPKTKKIKISELAVICDLKIIAGNGGGDGAPDLDNRDFEIADVATLQSAKPNELSFFGNRKYLEELKNTQAGAVILPESAIEYLPKSSIGLITSGNPMLNYGRALDVLYPEEGYVHHISSRAKIHESAKIGKNCYIGDNVYIGEDVEIGDDVIVGTNSIIGRGCIVGAGSRIRSNVTISHTIMGEHAIINSGARIGESGFGIIPAGDKMMYIKQLGRVIIGNRVRIGANTTIDRGSVEDTMIGDDTIIDNLVQIGHNVHIGKMCIIVAQVGIAGSTKIGDGVVLAGQVGIAGHVKIGDGVVAAAKSGIAGDIAAGQIVGGIPAVDVNIWKRQAAFLKMSVSKKKGTKK